MVLRRLAIAIDLLFGLLGSQLPEFAQQYRQRLGGALDELMRMIGQFDTEVAARSLNRSQGLDLYLKKTTIRWRANAAKR
jgi:Protein of unknown function (DUF2937)